MMSMDAAAASALVGTKNTARVALVELNMSVVPSKDTLPAAGSWKRAVDRLYR